MHRCSIQVLSTWYARTLSCDIEINFKSDTTLVFHNHFDGGIMTLYGQTYYLSGSVTLDFNALPIQQAYILNVIGTSYRNGGFTAFNIVGPGSCYRNVPYFGYGILVFVFDCSIYGVPTVVDNILYVLEGTIDAPFVQNGTIFIVRKRKFYNSNIFRAIAPLFFIRLTTVFTLIRLLHMKLLQSTFLRFPLQKFLLLTLCTTLTKSSTSFL